MRSNIYLVKIFDKKNICWRGINSTNSNSWTLSPYVEFEVKLFDCCCMRKLKKSNCAAYFSFGPFISIEKLTR